MAEHRVAGRDPREVRADRLDDARHVDAAPGLRGPRAAEAHQAADVRVSAQLVRVERVDRGVADADQHAVRLERGDTRERVLAAALALADAGGTEALSMRKLAQALGVEAMSLHNHVANKGDLVDAMVDAVVEEIELPAAPGDWRAAVRRCAISAHEAFLRHPWACNLVLAPGAGSGTRAPRVRYMEWLLGTLRAEGFPPGLTYHAYHVLDSHILGFTLWEVGHVSAATRFAGDQDFAAFVAGFVEEMRAEGYPNVAEHAEQHVAPPDDGVHAFEFALDLLLDGLERARASV